MFNRSVLMKVHALLAAFILPVAIMFFVTGAFYTWGIKGGYDTTVHKVYLKKPLQNNHQELVSLAKEELNKRNISAPTGQAKIKTIGNSFKLEWSGSSMDVIVQPTSEPLIAQIEIKNAHWYRQFVQLHKAKGGILFKVYAAILSTALLILLFTGFVMAWQMPKFRRITLISTALGITVFVVMIMFS